MPETSQPIWSVQTLSEALKRHVETLYNAVKVRGEIISAKRHSSGHLYFSLKEGSASLDAICWRSTLSGLTFQPTDGLEVVCQGYLTTYPGRSKYQLIVQSFQPLGQGALLQILEDRKQRLKAEGLFDTIRKRPLPRFPKYVGLITSSTGAVIQDMLNRLALRLSCEIMLWPVAVQGDYAVRDLLAALKSCHSHQPRPDVLIIARGGGSMEDLWAFNDEALARAVAASEIPVISAVGHETDITLIDFASDVRAPTPTAAAEMVLPTQESLRHTLRLLKERSGMAIEGLWRHESLKLRGPKLTLDRIDRYLDLPLQRLDELKERLMRAICTLLYYRKQHLGKIRLHPPRQITEQLTLRHLIIRFHRANTDRLAFSQDRLKKLYDVLQRASYTATLQRGFCLLTDAAKNIKKSDDCHQGDKAHLHFFDDCWKIQLDERLSS